MIKKSDIIIAVYSSTMIFIVLYCLMFPIYKAAGTINLNQPIAPDLLEQFKGGRALEPTDYVNNEVKPQEIWLAKSQHLK